MFEVVSQTPKEVFLVYIAFFGAALVVYPLIRFFVKTAAKGMKKWK